jgi:hypothetical protein
LWPTGDWSAETLAAVLNGPVANAFVAAQEGNSDIALEVIKAIPIPRFEPEMRDRVTSLIAEYLSLVESDTLLLRSTARTPDRILREIDAAVLSGYDLPPRLERELLDYFNGEGERRPVPFHFADYFPEDFQPYFSLADYLSEEFHRSRAKEFRGRYKPPPADVLAQLRAATGIEGE